MKKLIMMLAVAVWIVGCTPNKITDSEISAATMTLDFGDNKSSTLTTKAWGALKKKDYPELFAYTNKVIELYGEEGKKMNAALTDFAPMDKAFDLWALNDVGTSLYMQAEAYVAMKMYPEAAKTYRTMAEDYNYTQCWDKKGWFWRPAWGAAAKAKEYELKI